MNDLTKEETNLMNQSVNEAAKLCVWDTILKDSIMADESCYDLQWKAALEKAERRAMSFQSQFYDLQEKYNELIMAVATCIPYETRHETALRYIRQAEHGKNNIPYQQS